MCASYDVGQPLTEVIHIVGFPRGGSNLQPQNELALGQDIILCVIRTINNNKKQRQRERDRERPLVGKGSLLQ